MIIKTIEEAESFVASNKDFSWDGWDIIYKVQDDYAEYLADGVFDRSTKKWYRVSRYSYKDCGWNIPNSVIK